jgi:hypothetical protein
VASGTLLTNIVLHYVEHVLIKSNPINKVA